NCLSFETLGIHIMDVSSLASPTGPLLPAPEISSCRSAVALTAPLLQALRYRCRRVNSLFKDRGSVLEGGVKVCKRPLVNEVLGLLLTEFFPDPNHKGATPIQRGL